MLLNNDNFFSLLNKLDCFENYPHVAVGVSGGPDSIALVYLVSKWIKLKKGKLSALIFDHRIRANSKEESNQVKNILNNLNIKSVILKPKKNNLLKKNMSQARINRFDGLINFCKANKILHLFLGHHFNDNIETYLIRKINGSNFEGLASMETISYFDKIQILRPFLNLEKKTIMRYNKKNNLVFLNDPSNNDLNYTRVKVRNFLNSKSYKELVKLDFLDLRKDIPLYKEMIWSCLIGCVTDVKSNQIKINKKKLLKYDSLIIERIILINLKFFSQQNYKVRSSKITNFMNEIKKSTFKFFNLSGILIKKKGEFLIFSQK